MIEVREVKTKKEKKEFLDFPLRLYKGNPYFVPPLYGDEKKIFNKDYVYYDTCEAVYYNAYINGKIAGRISGILQKASNEKRSEKRIRFTRFDSINNVKVAKALFNAVEEWGRSKGMDTICGPLGFSDLEREGLLIEGFNELSTFEEQYNYEYYAALVESYGFEKDTDWLEHELRKPEKKNEMLSRVAQRTLELNKLHVASTDLPKKKYIEKYRDGFFDCLDVCYSKLYGTVPLTREAQDEIISQFLLIVNKEFAMFICDENDNVVAFGICFPGIADALKKSGGRLTPAALVRVLKAVKNPSVIDLGLVGVRPEYQNTGINAVILEGLLSMLESGNVEKCETNLNLEDNTGVLSQWKYFSTRQHKRRRAYTKKI